MIKVFFYSILFVFPFPGYAKNYLPVPVAWYDMPIYFNEDSCNRILWTYQNFDVNKTNLIKKVFARDISSYECKVSTLQLDHILDEDIPVDFPSSFDDLVKLMSMSNSPKPEDWSIKCEGHGPIEIHHSIYPSYDCPIGTRIKFTVSGDKICTSEPDVCYADVVGRNLDVANLGGLGHVGLTTNFNYDTETHGNYVLEVLNEDKVIQVNTLKDFKNRVPGKFWGAVYGLPNLSFISKEQAEEALKIGYAQHKFNPHYTLGIDWQEGRLNKQALYDTNLQQFVSENDKNDAKFRCDSFVNFCYLKGFGQTPVSYLTVPLTLFNAFKNIRDDIYSSKTEAVSSALKSFQKENSPEHYNLDTVLRQFLKDQRIRRGDKIHYLWSKAKESKGIQFDYLMDNLGGLMPLVLVPELIDYYEQESDEKKKNKIIIILEESTREAISTDKMIRKLQIKNIINVQHFLTELLKNENNFYILRRAITESLSILPKTRANYYLLTDAMARLQKQLDVNARLSQEYVDLYLLRIACANHDMRNWFLPKLLSSTEAKGNRFSENVFAIINIYKYHFDQITKSLLKNYINSLTVQSDLPFYDAAKLMALAEVSTSNQKDKINMIATAVLKEKNICKKARILKGLDHEIIDQMSPDDLNALRVQIFSLLNKTFNKNRFLLLEAFTRVGQKNQNGATLWKA